MSKQIDRIPEGAEWATAPLLDVANLDRYVWYVFNGNTKFATPLQIVKIGRTNVHVNTWASRPSSLRVDPDTHGHTADGTTGSGHSVSVHTEQWRLDSASRRELSDLLLRHRSLRVLPVATLERMVELTAPGENLTERRHRDEEAIQALLTGGGLPRYVARQIVDLFYGGGS